MSQNFRFDKSRGTSAIFVKKNASAQRGADVALEVFDEKHNRYELRFPANVIPLKARKQLREGIETAVFADVAERDLCLPLFEGQLGIQLDNDTLYRADSLDRGDWVPVITGSPVDDVQEVVLTFPDTVPIGTAFNIQTGVYSGGGPATVAGDSITLPNNGADFVDFGEIQVYLNGQNLEKGASLGSGEAQWVSSTQLALWRKIKKGSTIKVLY